MRKLLTNRWFILASVFALSLTALSCVTYQKARTVCVPAEDSFRQASGNSEVLWDAFSSQLPSISVR